MADGRRTILFVHGADEWYGSDYVLHEIVESLHGTEFDPVVLVPDDGISEIGAAQRLSGRLRAGEVEVHVLPLTVLRRRYMTPWGVAGLSIRAPRSVRGALAAVASRDVALVHSHTAAVLTGADVARAIGAPHVWHVSEIVERPRIVRNSLARRVVRASDRVVVVSNAVRDHLIATEPRAAAKTSVIHNAVDVARFSSAGDAKAAPADDIVVGMIGRVGTWKGQELLLSAARRVCADIANVRFLLAGGVLNGDTGAFGKLRAMAQDYGISDRVSIQEYCTDIPALLREIDVFVQPSLRPDPLPTTILEAMASARPVVATAHGGASEMVVDGMTGLLTPPGDAGALAMAISRLVRDPNLRLRMGSAGRDRVAREFSPAAFSAAYLKLYREVAGAPLPRST